MRIFLDLTDGMRREYGQSAELSALCRGFGGVDVVPLFCGDVDVTADEDCFYVVFCAQKEDPFPQTERFFAEFAKLHDGAAPSGFMHFGESHEAAFQSIKEFFAQTESFLRKYGELANSDGKRRILLMLCFSQMDFFAVEQDDVGEAVPTDILDFNNSAVWGSVDEIGEATELARALSGQSAHFNLLYAKFLGKLAHIKQSEDCPNASDGDYKTAAALYDGLFAEGSVDVDDYTGFVLDYADHCAKMDEIAESERRFRSAIDLLRSAAETQEMYASKLMSAYSEFADMYREEDMYRYTGAREDGVLCEALEDCRRLNFDEKNYYLHVFHRRQGSLYDRMNHPKEAEEAYRTALDYYEMYAEERGSDLTYVYIASDYVRFAEFLRFNGKREGTEQLLEKALEYLNKQPNDGLAQIIAERVHRLLEEKF